MPEIGTLGDGEIRPGGVYSVDYLEGQWANSYTTKSALDKTIEDIIITRKRGSKMNGQNFKVGDRIHTGEGSYIYNVIKLDDSGMVYCTGEKGSMMYSARDTNGYWTNGSEVFIKHGSKPEGLNFLVKGKTPELIVKIGCKEFPVKGINKLAKRLLAMAKASSMVTGGLSVIDGEGFTKEDVKNAIKWLKENKITS